MENLLELRKFVAPEFVFGNEAYKLAGQYASNLGVSKVLLVSDRGVADAGWMEKVKHSLHQKSLATVDFLDVSANPRDHEVMAGADLYREKKCDAIVVVGGGSPMDCAKGIGIVSTNQQHVLEFEGVDMVTSPGPPLICIPTTAGTSADVSQFAIITDTGRKVKIAIVSKTVVPDVALIDPLLTTTMDEELTACTGLDALTHAVEAFVSNANSPITDMFALEAIGHIGSNLVGAIEEPDNLQYRGKMMLGSLMAGLAFSNAILGAVHAMAHSLGGFLDLPHGACNAILLDSVIDANFSSAAKRYKKIGAALGAEYDSEDPEEQKQKVLQAVRDLKKKAGLDKKLKDLGMSGEDIPVLAERAMADACMITNPCQLEQEEIQRIYEKAL